MNSYVEKLISRTFLFDVVSDRRHKRELVKWVENFRPCPPPHLVKQSIVKEYAKRFGLSTLVETGTYLGFMIRATLNTFQEIYSIELEDALFLRAQRKFARFAKVKLLHGDSGTVLTELLRSIDKPCLFWLDAHHSSGATFTTGKGELLTPIVAELSQILAHPMGHAHVVLIDDAREFTGESDYPTLRELGELVKKLQPNFIVENRDDVIRVHRRESAAAD